MSAPARVDLAAIEARVLGNAEAARLRAAQQHVNGHDDSQDPLLRDALSPLVSEAVRALDARIPTRYAHAVPRMESTWEWVVHAGDGAGLLLLGPTGTGKTYEAYGALRSWAASGQGKGGQVAFGNAADLLDACRPDGALSVEALCTAPLLLIDDLGAFKASEWTAEVLYRIVDWRWSWCLPTLATSNLTPVQLGDALGDRLASRLQATMTTVPMVGADQRRRGATP